MKTKIGAKVQRNPGVAYHRFLMAELWLGRKIDQEAWSGVVRQAETMLSAEGVAGEGCGVRVSTPFFVKSGTGAQWIERRGFALGKAYVLRKRTLRKGE